MSGTIYPLRLSDTERREFGHAARAEGVSLAVWLRQAAKDRAQTVARVPACLSYPDKVELSSDAERNPREFINTKLSPKRELHR